MQTNKSFTDSNFTSMLNSYNYNLHPGDIVAGTIFHQEKENLIVDIGAKTAGYLPHEEIISIYHAKPSIIYYLQNETREFFILAYNKHSQQLILSIKRLEYIRAWKRIKQIETEDIILNIKVIKINKGGLIVNLEGLQGFVPKSHVAIDINKESVENKYIKCKLLLANEKTNQLILSHKKAIISISSSKFKIGKIVTGKIIKTKAYGVFIQIYGILALLHISEVTSKNIKDINSIFSIGDKIKVKILHIDMKQGRLSVSQRNID
uniref:30S ribosomal protein S1 n=1 Tax=Mastocarpus papillatus TaxID=31436 RepID=A0A342RZC6_9FLOR|nr:30S ribosomal protein S1 [Mastocarpus papillatus]AOL58072.1 30S ribosomal protein S1 [Mastocarpus papillatus]